MFQKLFLDLSGNTGAQEDAHRALAGGQFMQLLFLRHGGTSFATRKDDGLHLFWNGELGAESCCCSLERGDPRCDMVAHAVTVEEGHLFLYRPVDAGVACVQAYDEFPFVIKLFHKGELFFQVHVGGAANCCLFFSA